MPVSANGGAPGIMTIEDLRRILVIGAGTMGQQIGLQCAMYGYDLAPCSRQTPRC